MTNALVWGATVLGIVLLGVTVLYWLEPGGSLPAFFPGYVPGSTHVHLKHGIATLILGLALFALAWFRSGPKKA